MIGERHEISGLEAGARGLVRPGHACLNLVSGLFGRYMGYWLRDFGAELHELEVGYDDAIDPAEVDRYQERHRVKSGITGWAQVSGLRGQTSIADRVEWDNYYIRNWSLRLDLRIIALTLLEVLHFRG